MNAESLSLLDRQLYKTTLGSELKDTLRSFHSKRGDVITATINKIKGGGMLTIDFSDDFILSFLSTGPQLDSTHDIICHLIAEILIGNDYYVRMSHYLKTFFNVSDANLGIIRDKTEDKLENLKNKWISACTFCDYDKTANAACFTAEGHEIRVSVEAETEEKLAWEGEQLFLAFILLTASDFLLNHLSTELNVVLKMAENPN